MAAVLTSPLAFMAKTRAICNIEGGPAHPGPLFFARTSAELRFSRQIAKENFPREQLGVGHFPNGGDFDQHMRLTWSELAPLENAFARLRF
ncbi:hypothetical protein [Slackia isoflavoniconvertens]|uniref:hypothetical protein n=1 Tax=Slackia isoflavoniconvertens TaxID=572010 RepID=UPI002E775009|nr:hypothetical protein [Slackia isoflavoniconvertens]